MPKTIDRVCPDCGALLDFDCDGPKCWGAECQDAERDEYARGLAAQDAHYRAHDRTREATD